MGKLSRTKGAAFERWVASQFREAYGFLTGVRRAQQGAGAEQSDVTGVPGLWIECRDGKLPQAERKLEQAERDVVAAAALNPAQPPLIPVAVTHRSGTSRHDSQVTLRLGDFLRIARAYVAQQTAALEGEQED